MVAAGTEGSAEEVKPAGFNDGKWKVHTEVLAATRRYA